MRNIRPSLVDPTNFILIFIPMAMTWLMLWLTILLPIIMRVEDGVDLYQGLIDETSHATYLLLHTSIWEMKNIQYSFLSTPV